MEAEATPDKHEAELEFWRREIDVYVRWYDGALDSLYGVPAPTEDERVRDSEDERLNAIRTWAKSDADKYLHHLALPADAFDGMRVLDVGCGPLPYCLAFTGCQITGLDELVDQYRELGYPLEAYSDRLTHLTGSAEQIPAQDASFDAVISVNALDHVSDFGAAAREIARVVRPGGVVRIELHYHEPTACEPNALDDDMVAEAFAALGLVKVADVPFTDFYPMIEDRGERLTIWTNDGSTGSETRPAALS